MILLLIAAVFLTLLLAPVSGFLAHYLFKHKLEALTTYLTLWLTTGLANVTIEYITTDNKSKDHGLWEFGMICEFAFLVPIVVVALCTVVANVINRKQYDLMILIAFSLVTLSISLYFNEMLILTTIYIAAHAFTKIGKINVIYPLTIIAFCYTVLGLLYPSMNLLKSDADIKYEIRTDNAERSVSLLKEASNDKIKAEILSQENDRYELTLENKDFKTNNLIGGEVPGTNFFLRKGLIDLHDISEVNLEMREELKRNVETVLRKNQNRDVIDLIEYVDNPNDKSYAPWYDAQNIVYFRIIPEKTLDEESYIRSLDFSNFKDTYLIMTFSDAYESTLANSIYADHEHFAQYQVQIKDHKVEKLTKLDNKIDKIKKKRTS